VLLLIARAKATADDSRSEGHDDHANGELDSHTIENSVQA